MIVRYALLTLFICTILHAAPPVVTVAAFGNITLLPAAGVVGWLAPLPVGTPRYVADVGRPSTVTAARCYGSRHGGRTLFPH